MSQFLSELDPSTPLVDDESLTKFRPVVGTESSILNSIPTKGYVWFAKDSKKIYYSDGDKFLPMGGNSGVFYSSADITEGDTSTDRIDFTYRILDIEGNEEVKDNNYKIPNKDDLIINDFTKALYKVKNVYRDMDNLLENSYIAVEKLPIAGGGGGGISGSTHRIIITAKGDKNIYFTPDSTDVKLKFNVTAGVLEGNKIVEIKYFKGTELIATDDSYQDFGDKEFDLTPYISQMTNESYSITIQVSDLLGAIRREQGIFIANIFRLSLSSDFTETILTTNNGILKYHSVPTGGGKLLDKKLSYKIYKNGNLLLGSSFERQLTDIKKEIPEDIPIPDIGVYHLEIQYSGQVPNSKDGDRVYSNILSYSVVSYNENPLLVAFIPSYEVEQYSTLKITYMIAADLETDELTDIVLKCNGEETTVGVPFNVINEWNIDFELTGLYNLSIKDLYSEGITFSNVRVIPYSGEAPTIKESEADLYLSAVGRSNNEILSENTSLSQRDKWIFKNYDCNFKNFAWGNINGWLRDENNISILRLNSEAKLEVNYYPFEKDVIKLNDRQGGLTIELDFKISGVTNFEEPLIHCLSHDGNGDIQVGFQVTGQESTINTLNIHATGGTIREGDDDETQAYNTAIQGLTAKFIEDKRIHLTWVIERNLTDYPMIKTYLNGIRSGITFYSRTDEMMQNKQDPAKIIFDSTFGNIDIYNIRIYKKPLAAKEVLDNYIATCGTIAERVEKYKSNEGLLDREYNISVEAIESGEYVLSVPYLKITGGEKLDKNKSDGKYYLKTDDSSIQLPQEKKDFRLVKEFEFIDQRGIHPNRTFISKIDDNNCLNGVFMYGQGTSSMEYPIKNLRFEWQMKDNNGEDVKFKVNQNDCPVDLICLKADYMESSGSHNTGTANLIYKLLNGLKMKTPAQEYYKSKVDYDIVTTIRGYPVIIFYRPDESSEYEFIGKYNLNLDKATQEPFGFVCDPEEKPASISQAKFGWESKENTFTSFDDDIVNVIHCYEFKNNGSDLANFINTSQTEDFETVFFKETTSAEGETAPNWYHSYESRYPEGDSDTGDDIDIASWFELCKWVNSTSVNEATNEPLLEPYIDSNGKIHYDDNKEYRLAKFKKEFTQHFDLDFTAFYYVLSHVLLMIDSRAKNMMIATWDNQIWYPIFYDMDTMLGLNNYGYNKFGYDVEDTHNNIYNGQKSVLWNNFRECFPSAIRTMYNSMQQNGLNYQGLIDNYNNNQADATNESIYNADSDYKYIAPFNEGYYDGLNKVWVKPGGKDYLYASQGNRSMHREWWIDNRIAYFNGKYLSNDFKADRYEMRLYTPKANEDNYTAVLSPTLEEFNSGKYYQKIEQGEGFSFIPATGTFKDEDYFYFIKAPNALKESIENIPPSNDFYLTPLHNQYLAVAYGGDNGVTVGPEFAEANEHLFIKTPSGSEFTDTETYIYGGSTLKDLGDLSPQYLGAFKFPTKPTKLEKLTLGNKNNQYYNFNFSNLAIGQSAPYLKELDITNCSGLSGRSQNLEYCQNIQRVLATGSGLTELVLPSNGIVKELRLPNTIKNLYLINQPYLFEENFTVGTYDSNSESYSENNFSNLINLKIEDTPGINSFDIIKKASILQKYSLKNVAWEIDSSDVDFNSMTIPVLEILQSKDPFESNIKSLTGTLTFKKDNAFTESNLLALYDKYWKIFPGLKFEFVDMQIYNVTVYNGNNKVYWEKKIAHGNSFTKEFFKSGPNGAFKNPLMTDTDEYKYTFTNKWRAVLAGEEYIIENDGEGYPVNVDGGNLIITSHIELYPIFESVRKKYYVTFKNYDDSKISEEEYEYGTDITTILPNIVPYRDDSDLKEYDMTYAFLGYNTGKDFNSALTFDNEFKVTRSETFYAIYKKISVYENIHHEYFDYFDCEYSDNYDDEFFKDNGVYVVPKRDLNLQGKITIPALSPDGKKVIGLGRENSMGYNFFKDYNMNPTSIFFEKNSNVRYIGLSCFNECNSLKYFEFIDSIRYIAPEAFRLVPLQNYNISSSNLKHIGYFAFNQAFQSSQPITIFISGSVKYLDTFAIANNDNIADKSNIIIGSPDNLSKLDLGEEPNPGTVNDDTLKAQRIRQNGDGSKITALEFYSELYDKDNFDVERTPVYLGLAQYTIKDCIGIGASQVLLYN